MYKIGPWVSLCCGPLYGGSVTLNRVATFNIHAEMSPWTPKTSSIEEKIDYLQVQSFLLFEDALEEKRQVA